MRPGMLAGLLILLSCALLLVAVAIALAGGSVSAGRRDTGGLVLTAALGLLAAGAIVLAVSGPRPFDGRGVRIGFTLLGTGIIAVLATADVTLSSMLVVVYLLGGFLTFIGAAVIALALLRAGGRPRQIVVLFLIGLLIAAAGGATFNASVDSSLSSVLEILALGLALVAGLVMLAAVASIGVLAIRASGEGGVASA